MAGEALREKELFQCPGLDENVVYLGEVETDFCAYHVFSVTFPGNRECRVHVKIFGSDKKLSRTESVLIESLVR